MTGDSQVWLNVIFSGALIVIVGLLYRIIQGGVSGGSAKPAVEPGAAPRAIPAPPSARSAPGGIDDEVVAVISAAVASYMAEAAPGVAYAVTGISPRANRQKEQRPVWGFAGIKQNTEPF